MGMRNVGYTVLQNDLVDLENFAVAVAKHCGE
jgi:hypothetical protein